MIKKFPKNLTLLLFLGESLPIPESAPSVLLLLPCANGFAICGTGG